MDVDFILLLLIHNDAHGRKHEGVLYSAIIVFGMIGCILKKEPKA